MLQEMGLSKPDKPEDGDTSSLDEGRLPVNGNQIIKPQNQILHMYKWPVTLFLQRLMGKV